MRRLLIPALFLLFVLPAIACGSTSGTATKTGNATTVPQSATAAPVAAGGVTATARSTAPSTAASSAPSAAPAATGVYPPNTLVSVKNWDMAVNRVERPGKELAWSDFGNKSAAAGEWLIVVFDLKNTGTTNFGINLTDVQLNAPGGVTYKPSTDGGALTYGTFKKAQQLGGQVPPGVSVQYYIVFDVAPNLSGLVFQFNQDTKPKFTLP